MDHVLKTIADHPVIMDGKNGAKDARAKVRRRNNPINSQLEYQLEMPNSTISPNSPTYTAPLDFMNPYANAPVEPVVVGKSPLNNIRVPGERNSVKRSDSPTTSKKSKRNAFCNGSFSASIFDESGTKKSAKTADDSSGDATNSFESKRESHLRAYCVRRR